MLITLFPMVTEVKLVHPRNAWEPMLSPPLITTICKLSLGMARIAVVGSVASRIEVQPENAVHSMLVTLIGMVTEVRPVQSSNALPPILVTLSGMVTEVKPVQPLNALLAIVKVPDLT